MSPRRRALAAALQAAWDRPGRFFHVSGEDFRVWRLGEYLESDLVLPDVRYTRWAAVWAPKRLGGFRSLRLAAERLEAALRARDRLLADLDLGLFELARAVERT